MMSHLERQETSFAPFKIFIRIPIGLNLEMEMKLIEKLALLIL